MAALVLSLIGLAAIRSNGGGPPLYDGLCTQNAYLSFGASPAPGTARNVVTVQQQFPITVVMTSESIAPQAQAIFESGSFAVPPGSTITISITAVQPPATKPSDGSIEGNVYEIAAVGPGNAPIPLSGKRATIALESPPSGSSQLVLERFDSNHWTALSTVQSGCATTEEATSASLGLFALVAQGATAPAGGGGQPASGGGGTGLLVVLGILVVLALLVGGVRLSRSRR